MKKLTLLITFIIVLTQLHAQKYYDKKLHFAAGAVISAGASFITKDIDKGYIFAIGAGCLAAVAKESYDATGRGTPDFYDAMATAAGTVTTALVVRTIRRKIAKHKQIKNEKRGIKF